MLISDQRNRNTLYYTNYLDNSEIFRYDAFR